MTDDLREQIADTLAAPAADWLAGRDRGHWLAKADALLAGPLAPLLADLDRLTAERDNARAAAAALARVRTLADTWQGRAGHWQSWTPAGPAAHYGATLRKAIDGTP